MNFTRTRNRGFTLIEMLVTILVYGFIFIAVTDLIVAMFRQSLESRSALNSIDQVNAVSSTFVNEVRNAQTGNDGSFAINQASTTQIIFFSPYGSFSTTTVLRIRYFLASSTLYKGVIKPTGSPLTYNSASEIIRPEVTNVMNGTTSVFTYYTGSYAGTSSPLAQPVNVTNVAFVKITLYVAQQDVRSATTTYNFTTGATVRSLKTNLGN